MEITLQALELRNMRSSIKFQRTYPEINKSRETELCTIGSSLRPGQLEISTRMVILIRTHTKKYTKGDSIKKFFAGYVGWLIRTICTKFGDNWTNGRGNID